MMSEVKRYTMQEYGLGMGEDDEGDYVEFADYEAIYLKFTELKQAFEESQAELVSRGMKLAALRSGLDNANLNERARKVMEELERNPVGILHENSAALFKSLDI